MGYTRAEIGFKVLNGPPETGPPTPVSCSNSVPRLLTLPLRRFHKDGSPHFPVLVAKIRVVTADHQPHPCALEQFHDMPDTIVIRFQRMLGMRLPIETEVCRAPREAVDSRLEELAGAGDCA